MSEPRADHGAASPLEPLTSAGATFDHVAVAARRIRDLLPVYRDLLGGAFAGGGDNSRVGYRGLQLAFPGGGRVELLEPLTGSTFFDRFFERGGAVHHLTFKVDDVRGAIERLGALGFTPTSPYLKDDDWQEVFVHPREASGVLIQIVQVGAGHGPRTHGFSLEDVLGGRGVDGDGVPSP